MTIHYVLTAFSTAMFGVGGNANIRMISEAEAQELVSDATSIMATRVSHEKLARHCFPQAGPVVVRYAVLQEGVNAVHIHYRGPPITDSGEIPLGSSISYYLIQVRKLIE